MRYLTILFALGVQILSAAGMRTVIDDRRCGVEFESLRFVATPHGPRVPLYWDQKLISYLTQTYAATEQSGPASTGPTVLTLYSATPMIFRQGPYVFLTTGLLSQIKSEAELIHVFERPATIVAGRREAPSIRTCGVLTVESAGFEAVWSRMNDTLLRYEARTHLRLKRRPDAGEATPAESAPLEQ